MPSAETARLVVLDPSALFYHALQAALARAYDGTIVDACNATNALQAIDSARSALILIGPNWSPPEALRLCRTVRDKSSAIRIVILSALAEESLLQTDAVYSGASACLGPAADAETLVGALRQVQRGATLFAPDILRAAHQLPKPTPRELDVLGALAQGKTDREIADALHISEQTVGTHLRSIFRKLEVHDRRAAVRRARQRGWV
ncbi:MAG: response regulator transcription factor [Chloroflexi bacterium]|nr:response regulator transcription factor [Chloroflexota bacterium]